MKIKYGLAALALAGSAFAVSGCGAAGSGMSSVSYAGECTGVTDSPDGPTTDGTGIEVAKTSTGSDVVGQLWASCMPSPEQQILTVQLWYSTNDTDFKFINSRKYTNVPSQSEYTEYSVGAPCIAGVWKVKWSVVGVDDMNDSYSATGQWIAAAIDDSDCNSPNPTAVYTATPPVSV